ncbi:hypothetical protein ACJMK2_022926 [Sinanodonta woodiana]|uniref:Uncharacterized protein n=1 Tax=Sinanodonta woodiana TaxID=1069815 RepID=A0ABD3TMB6_SINWO
MDAVPFLSQIKSFAQWASRNSKGARETQMNFLKLCPVVSQGTSMVQAIAGNSEGARETQMQFLKGVNGMVDSVPGVGHVKGAVHYVFGDREGGDNAMKAASHTTGVIGGGVGGFIVGGPVGAVAGGVAGGILMDDIITLAEVAVNGEEAKPYGACDTIMRIIKDPTDGGNYVDLIGASVLDGMTGYTAGQGIGKKIEYHRQKGKLAKTIGKENAKMIVDAGDKMRQINSNTKINSNKQQVMTRVKDNATGNIFDGHNKQMRKILKTTKDITNGPTELQTLVPDAKQVLERSVTTCAEQHAYNKALKNNPKASPGDLSSVSVKWNPKSQRPVTVQRCANCREFSPAMGTVITDLIPETPVPLIVGSGATAAAIALGVSIHALSQKVELDSDSDSDSDDQTL